MPWAFWRPMFFDPHHHKSQPLSFRFSCLLLTDINHQIFWISPSSHSKIPPSMQLLLFLTCLATLVTSQDLPVVLFKEASQLNVPLAPNWPMLMTSPKNILPTTIPLQAFNYNLFFQCFDPKSLKQHNTNQTTLKMKIQIHKPEEHQIWWKASRHTNNKKSLVHQWWPLAYRFGLCMVLGPRLMFHTLHSDFFPLLFDVFRI